jgi:hypothetical protein
MKKKKQNPDLNEVITQTSPARPPVQLMIGFEGFVIFFLKIESNPPVYITFDLLQDVVDRSVRQKILPVAVQLVFHVSQQFRV